MNIISQEVEADPDVLTDELRNALEFDAPEETRVFLFGSWASYKKAFTEGDVDVFIGKPGATADPQPPVTVHRTHVDVVSTDGDVYEDCRLEIHWGDVEDFLPEVPAAHRTELTDRLA